MDMTGNTILITGGGSGIGRALAESFHAGGNRVIIAGRDNGPLAEMVAGNPGMISVVLDITDATAIQSVATRLMQEHPALNVLVNNAGIMKTEDPLADPFDLSAAEATIATNLLGPIRLTAALLPHLRRQSKATILNLTSGLAFVPRAQTPTYCATKAAMHSYTQSLRFLLRDTTVQVIELVPPMIATDLMPGQRDAPRAMPLDLYIQESMALLEADGQAPEILVERAKVQRYAEARGDLEKVFAMVNSD